MSGPPAKRARADVILTPNQYAKWQTEHKVAPVEDTNGFSSKIYKTSYGDIVKEQILWRDPHGVWMSLQLYDNTMPEIFQRLRNIIFSDTQITEECIGVIEDKATGPFAEEIEGLSLASCLKVTPPLKEWFYVEIRDGFRLGVIRQEKLYRVLGSYEDRNGSDKLYDAMSALGMKRFQKLITLLAQNGICYFDWNIFNVGATRGGKLQLIDFAHTMMPLPFTLRKGEEHQAARADVLWRTAVMSRQLADIWSYLEHVNHSFKTDMLEPAKNDSDMWRRRAMDFMHEYAVPETDYEAVLDITMFGEM